MKSGFGRVGRGMVLAIALLAVSAFAGIAWADPIGPDCGSCFGGIYTLTGVITGDSATITITADMSGHDATITDIDQIAFKVASGGSDPISGTFQSFSIDGTANGSWGTAGDALEAGGLNSAGCDGSGAGFLCSAGNSSALFTSGDVFQWTFDVTLNPGANFLVPPDLSSLKINFSGPNCDKGCLLSEDIQLQGVPEPGTLMLLGSGLLSAGVARQVLRRRRQ